MKKINVRGLGYMELPTVALFESKRHDAYPDIDVLKGIVDSINRGKFEVMDYQKALGEVDKVVFLVDYNEFHGLDMTLINFRGGVSLR